MGTFSEILGESFSSLCLALTWDSVHLFSSGGYSLHPAALLSLSPQSQPAMGFFTFILSKGILKRVQVYG